MATMEMAVPTVELITQEVAASKASLPVVATVTDEQSHRSALEAVKLRKAFIANVEAKFKEPCDTTYKAWQSVTGLRKSFIDPVQTEITVITKGILGYEDGVRREAVEAQRLVAEAARKAQEEADAANAMLMPWDDEGDKVDVTTAVTAAIVATETRIAATAPRLAVVADIGTKNKPWAGRITNLRAFLKWCSEVETDERLEMYFSPDAPALNRLAKKVTDTGTVPGFEGYRERTVSR